MSTLAALLPSFDSSPITEKRRVRMRTGVKAGSFAPIMPHSPSSPIGPDPVMPNPADA